MTRASTTLFWFLLILVVSLGLYHTSYRVEELDQTLRHLNAQIEAEQRSIHILKAEYVFLTNPSRIEKASRKHLALEPTQPEQIASLRRLADIIPTRAEMRSRTRIKAMPVASLTAPQPRAVAEELDRVNTHLVIQKTEDIKPSARDRSLAMIGGEDSTFSYVYPGDKP